MTSFHSVLWVGLALLAGLPAQAKYPHRFDAKVEQLLTKEFLENSALPRVVFTGSSSIVRWQNLKTQFPHRDVNNLGFGGSQFSDLIHFYDELIKNQRPDLLFIYEGDNDIARGKELGVVFEQAKELITRIRSDLPQTRIVLIAPKPFLANWAKRDSYRKLNALLADLCESQDNPEFADVWSAMVDDTGVVLQDLFVADGDHMNTKGYAIWTEVISPFLD